jgi:hypothetical protein
VSYSSFPSLYRKLTPPSNTFYFFFAINLSLAVFVYFLVPETRKVSLEEMDTLFGGSDHVEKGADLLQVEDAKTATDTVAAADVEHGRRADDKV